MSKSPLKQTVATLPLLTRLLFKQCVSLVNRTLDRFPELATGIHHLDDSETKSTLLGRQLADSEKKRRELETVLGHTLDAVEQTQAELGNLRGAVSTHHRFLSGQLDRRNGDLEFLLDVAENTALELNGLSRAVGDFGKRSVGMSLQAIPSPVVESKLLLLETENMQLKAELAEVVVEVTRNQSDMALEIEKLRARITSLGGGDPTEDLLEIEPHS